MLRGALFGLAAILLAWSGSAAAADSNSRRVEGCPAAYQTCKSICMSKLRPGQCRAACKVQYNECLRKSGQ